MKWWPIIAGLVAIASIVAVAVGWSSIAGVPVKTAVVSGGEIRQYVDQRGKTRLPKTHLITMPYDGRIEQITLVEGDPVKSGQVVARVVPTDLKNALAEARAAVDRLEAAILQNNDTTVEQTGLVQSKSFLDSMVKTQEAARARTTAGKARLDYAETNLDRIRRLARTGARSEDDVDRATLRRVESEIDYRQDVLIAQAMDSITAAAKLLPDMIQQYIVRKGLARAVLEQQKAEAEARLAQINAQIDRGTLTGPPTGGVVLERLVSNERYQPAGTVLMKIGRLEDLEGEADVLSQDVVDVKLGDAVSIYGPAVGRDVGAGAGGVVHRIHPAGFAKISSLGVEQQRVKVIVRFAPGVLDEVRASGGLGVEFRVRVRIYTASKEGALVVPRSALFRGDEGGWNVFAVRGGQATLQPVQVGLMNDQIVEITDGLTAGERVILAPESNLTPGTKVSFDTSQ